MNGPQYNEREIITRDVSQPRATEQFHGRLTSLRDEVQFNGKILDELVMSYGMFRFTGGTVPMTCWRLVSLASYIKHPFASERITACEAAYYCDLAERIMVMGRTVEAGRPRTLQQRWKIAEMFGGAASEVRAIGHSFESGISSLLKEIDF